MGVKQHYKKVLQKKNVSKSFTKKSTKNPKPIFVDFVLSRFRAFLRRVQKQQTLVLFWPLTHPPTTGVADLFCRRFEKMTGATCDVHYFLPQL
jgi:hypothetical protein